MDNNSKTTGIGLCGILGVAFVILKLCHVIEWPWVWVTAPFWAPLAIVLAIILVIVILKVIAKIVGRINKW